jgi:hypothetical protein
LAFERQTSEIRHPETPTARANKINQGTPDSKSGATSYAVTPPSKQ